MGILQTMIKKLAITKTKATIDKLQKDLKDEPELKKRVDNLKRSYSQLESEMEIFCKMNPNSPLCDNKSTKPKWK